MKKEYALAVLFFGSAWGAFEAVLGGMLHTATVRHASIPLAVIALIILTIARVYFPKAGSSTMIASCAMLFKLANTPFFGCHLLGIFMLGLSYDLIASAVSYDPLRNRFKPWNNALFGLATTYLGFASFALLITYVFRYPHWSEGWPKVLYHVGVAGTAAAVANAVMVPVTVLVVDRLKTRGFALLEFRSRFAVTAASLITATLWIAGATLSF